MRNIALFASGSGSNAENIAIFFENHINVNVALIATNRGDAYVVERAKRLNIPIYIFNKNEMNNPEEFLKVMSEYNIDYIVLAGFLLLIPEYLTKRYEGRIVNIHPALLPKYGGAGMYGDKVHKAVKKAGEEKTGITIHNVNEKFDDGDIIFQATCEIGPEDTPEIIAEKVHKLEYEYFPVVIERHINEIFKNSVK